MDTMTISDVSKLLHITEESARNRISAGQAMPPSFRVGRRRLFLRVDVEQWVAERITRPPSPAAAGASPMTPAVSSASTSTDGTAQVAEQGAAFPNSGNSITRTGA